MQPAIHVEHLTKRFGDVLAVDGVGFAVPAGTTTALLGGNGAGKTTTIAMILGLLLPTAGRVHVLGVDMGTERYKALGRMNFSSPYVDLPKRLTVRENLKVYAMLYAVADADRRIATLIGDLDLGDLAKRPAGTLSAGQRSRLSLAKALLNRPEVLLLDEPTASLDPDSADRVRAYLQAYQKASGATVLLASHNMREVERLCSHVVMLRRGQVVDQAAPQALLARYGRDNMEDVFLDIARERRGEAAEAATP